MDLSALIFVALAVAWAVYLIPKALKHHDEVVRSRSVEKFSHTMRVLARREPVDRRNARLVVSPVRASLRPPVETKVRVTPDPVPAPTVAEAAARAPRRTPPPQVERASARRAAKRRRTVLAVLVALTLLVVGLAAGSVVAWAWTAAPATLLVAWLVACRVSVRSERARRARSAIEVGAPGEVDAPEVDAAIEDTDPTGEVVAVTVDAAPAAPAVGDNPAAEAPAVTTGEIPVVGGWDMVPTTLPTYVSKPAAQRRTVSTIDLDSTGVWSSGRSDEDSALARSAEQSARTAREAEAEERRSASGA